MSSKRLDSIADYRRHGFRLEVVCRRCTRRVLIDPTELIMLCGRRGWSLQMALLEPRLRCAKCGSRDTRCGPMFNS